MSVSPDRVPRVRPYLNNPRGLPFAGCLLRDAPRFILYRLTREPLFREPPYQQVRANAEAELLRRTVEEPHAVVPSVASEGYD